MGRLARPDAALATAAAALAFAFVRVVVWPLPLWRLRLPNPSGHEQLADLLGVEAHGAFRFGAFVAATMALYGASILLARQAKSRWVFVLAPCLFAGVLFMAAPTASHDVYHYLAEGRLLEHYGANPLSTAPAALAGADDPILSALVDWRKTPAPYGTFHVALMAVAVALGGGKVIGSVLFVRLFACVAYLGATLAVARLAPLGARGEASVAFAWNPLVLFEAVVNMHNDLIMGALAIAALLATVRRRYVLATALFVISALVKFATVPVACLAVVYALSADARARRRVLLTATAGAAVCAGLYVPFVARWSDTAMGNTRNVSSIYAVAALFATGYDSALRAALIGTTIVLVAALGVRLYRQPTTQRLIESGMATTVLVLFALARMVWPWYALSVVALGAAATRTGYRRFLFLLTGTFLASETIVVWRWVFGAPQWNSPAYTFLTCSMMYGPLLFGLMDAVLWQTRTETADHTDAERLTTP